MEIFYNLFLFHSPMNLLLEMHRKPCLSRVQTLNYYIIKAPNRRFRCLGILSPRRWCGHLGKNTLRQISIAELNPWRERFCTCVGFANMNSSVSAVIRNHESGLHSPGLKMILGPDFALVLSLGVARLNSLSYLGPGGGGKLVLKGTTFKSSSLLFRSGNLQRTWTPRSMQHFTYLPPVSDVQSPSFRHPSMPAR